MEIFVSAGESSSDIHSAAVLKAFLEKIKTKSSIVGLGGSHLQKMGAELLMKNSEFSVMGGPLEIIGKLPKRRKLEKMVEARLLVKRPDFAFLVDNGEINLRLASLFHFFKVPVIYFIPPKVWVWRPDRIERIKQHVSLVLSILPFEELIYKEWEIPFKYIGNPIDNEIPKNLTKKLACEKLDLDPDKNYISIFLGSRHSEIKHHANIFAEAMTIFLKKIELGKRPEILLPIAPDLETETVETLFREALIKAGLENVEIKLKAFKNIPHYQASHLCLKASRAALVKSGTSTLEAAFLEIPMVLSYNSSWLSKILFKTIVGYRGFIGMVNLFLVEPAEAALGWTDVRPAPVVPELILNLCKPALIAEEFEKIYLEGSARDLMIEKLKLAKTKVRADEKYSPVERCVERLNEFCLEKNLIKRDEFI